MQAQRELRSSGRHFNRLDELEAGDEIKIETTNNTYVYKVNTKFVVEPEDLSVLDQNKDDKELTLITCEPMDNPTHRLIIKAEILEEEVQRDPF
ncbi:class D sortase [Paenibacillus apiarius]|uniref:class D sortase n=1 Tax=Paenibacillus apiarius TaxID=46240 RepID=UPI00300D582E